jgi:hypothetical protein
MNYSVNGYCLEWHLRMSNAFNECLVNPIKNLGLDIILQSWDGSKITDEDKSNLGKKPIIFCQLPPSEEILSKSFSKLIWIPMVDHIYSANQRWWNNLPKTIRIIAYSDFVYKRALTADLQVIRVKYYPNPNQFQQSNFNQPLTALYWNRRGLFSPRLIENICERLNIQRLFFLSKTDPFISKNLSIFFPNKIGKTTVEEIPDFLPSSDYLKILQKTNVFLAPRAFEGVGMSFLEAMASGIVVLAYNSPTMNEYINHKINGYLLSDSTKNFYQNIVRKIKKKVLRYSESNYILNKTIKIDDLNQLDLKNIGYRALSDTIVGYENWKNQLIEIKNFITDW